VGVLIKTVRIYGFRGLQNIELELEQITVLTGMNNTGKTSFLKALQLALGNSQFISQDDFFISDQNISDKIIVDLEIVSIDDSGNRLDEFDENWEILFTEERIKQQSGKSQYIPLRTIVTFDEIRNAYKTQQFILTEWPDFEKDGVFWYECENGKEKSFRFEEIPFFYMDAQRDILEDIKTKTSYLGKMISKIKYSPQDIKTIEDQIKKLNEKAVNSSDILSSIKTTLKELNTAMDTSSEGIEITPFTKRIRDLNKGLSIHYTDKKDSFSMEYHGMGTRSWSSLLTLKAFISLLNANAEKETTVFFPILAVEEPEAHLHPNAQKKLYRQISGIIGQKIISTHSPYIAASAELKEIRNFYSNETGVSSGRIEMDGVDPEDIRKIKRQVINTRGEIFFSKAIIFFEGETEEQALPTFTKHYFKKEPFEMGIDFVGVGGHGNYLPFLRFAEALSIPWFIFSDAETQVKKSVKKQFQDCHSPRLEADVIVFLDDGNNFEKQLIVDGYSEEIKKAMICIELLQCQNEQHKQAKRTEIESYNDEKLYDKIDCLKTQLGPVIADEIIKSGKQLPPKVEVLFKQIGKYFN
jgi:putative ATP-dependent endonuclease of OLD family